jgi:lysine biosynthesis protein LysW
MNSVPRKHKAPCPYCSFDVWVGDRAEVWDILVCQQCGTSLQVVNLDPPVLDYNWQDALDEEVFEYEDDWEGAAYDDDAWTY